MDWGCVLGWVIVAGIVVGFYVLICAGVLRWPGWRAIFRVRLIAAGVFLMCTPLIGLCFGVWPHPGKTMPGFVDDQAELARFEWTLVILGLIFASIGFFWLGKRTPPSDQQGARKHKRHRRHPS